MSRVFRDADGWTCEAKGMTAPDGPAVEITVRNQAGTVAKRIVKPAPDATEAELAWTLISVRSQLSRKEMNGLLAETSSLEAGE